MNEGTVFVVVADAAAREAIQRSLEGNGYTVHAYSSAEALLPSIERLERIPGERCALFDLYLPGRSGLELQAELVARHVSIPIVFIAGRDHVQIAIEAMRKGAYNFVEHHADEQRLHAVIAGALALDAEKGTARRASAALRARLDTLTTRERQVLDLVLQGALNKSIADVLGISIKTVELHRSRLMDKMGARSVVQLVQIAAPLWNVQPRVPAATVNQV